MSGVQSGGAEPPAELLWTHLLPPLPAGPPVRPVPHHDQAGGRRSDPPSAPCFREASSPSSPVCPVDGAVITPAEVRTRRLWPGVGPEPIRYRVLQHIADITLFDYRPVVPDSTPQPACSPRC